MNISQEKHEHFVVELQKLAAICFPGLEVGMNIEPIMRRIGADGIPAEMSYSVQEGYLYQISIK